MGGEHGQSGGAPPPRRCTRADVDAGWHTMHACGVGLGRGVAGAAPVSTGGVSEAGGVSEGRAGEMGSGGRGEGGGGGASEGAGARTAGRAERRATHKGARKDSGCSGWIDGLEWLEVWLSQAVCCPWCQLDLIRKRLPRSNWTSAPSGEATALPSPTLWAISTNKAGAPPPRRRHSK